MKVLQGARKRFVLATGSGKADAVFQVRAGETLPVSMVGESDWYLDAEADGKYRLKL
jgi:6-phosphogluconolactonase/glucosamine-6-phosphate isomerase/deaminase